jgi:hypothetical protein
MRAVADWNAPARIDQRAAPCPNCNGASYVRVLPFTPVEIRALAEVSNNPVVTTTTACRDCFGTGADLGRR